MFNSLCAINITVVDVYEALISLDIKKSADISPTVLQNCAEALCESLHHLFTLSLPKLYHCLDLLFYQSFYMIYYTRNSSSRSHCLTLMCKDSCINVYR